MSLVDELIKNNWLKTPEIVEAFREIKRADFLPKGMENLAEINEALPIGWGQTISQPLVVAFMLELLQPQSGERILDIGSGSGWTTALLAHCVSQQGSPKSQRKTIGSLPDRQIPNGKIISIEIIPELMEFGKKNVAKYNFIEKGIAEFICADGSEGYKEEAPYDKILASASVQTQIPSAWKEQLKIGGRIVTPVETSIWLLIKKSKDKFEETEYPGFVFVPFIEK